MFAVWLRWILGAVCFIDWQWAARGQLFVASASDSSPGKVGLVWDPSPDKEVAGYALLYESDGDACTNRLDFGNTTNVTVGGMQGGVTYHFTLVAYDRWAEESPPSNEIVYSPPVCPDPPLWASAAAGTYRGLFTNLSGADLPGSGSFSATVTSNGTFSACLQEGLSLMPLTGRFSPSGVFSAALGTQLKARSVWLQLDLAGDEKMTGEISDGNWVAGLAAYRAVYSSTNRAPQAGRYTIVTGASDVATEPSGYGYGSVNVDGSGAVTLGITLGDGVKVTQSSAISRQGLWPVYLPLYAGNGAMAGWLIFTNAIDRDIDGTLIWTKAEGATVNPYPGGFTNQFQAIGSRLDAIDGLRLFASHQLIQAKTHGQIVMEGGNLAVPQTNSMIVTRFSLLFRDGLKVFATVTGTNLSGLALTPDTGLFGGVVTNQITRKATAVNGAVLQKAGAGFGLFTDTNRTGSVILEFR